MLTHDIRSAIFDVIGGLRQVDFAKLDPATHLQLERVRTSGETLSRLVEEALHMLEGKESEFSDPRGEFGNLHLHRLLRDMEFRWGGRAQEHGLSFRLQVGSEIPTVISTDRLGLERILANMLSNALKYSDEGVVELCVSLEANGVLCFRVKDSGPGFSKTALNTLFTHGARAADTAKPGSGLGLHIAKNIADQMGAEIQVHGDTGGAEVSLLMPAQTWCPTAAAETETGTLPDLSDIRVLVAEDNKTNQLIIAQMLDDLGAEYEIADDGIEALHWLERLEFDIALVDIEMPRLSGLDLMRHIRSQKGKLASLPILAITAFVLRANRDAIFDAGGDRILSKPILSIETFGRAIGALLNVTGVRAQPGTANPEANDIDEARFSRLLEIAGPDQRPELLRRLNVDLTQVKTSLKAALDTYDRAGLRAQTHVLISLAGSVGADVLQRRSEELNIAAHQGNLDVVNTLGPQVRRLLDDLLLRLAREQPGEESVI